MTKEMKKEGGGTDRQGGEGSKGWRRREREREKEQTDKVEKGARDDEGGDEGGRRNR